MSSRRNGSVSRAAEAASKNRLHMDRNPQHSRLTDPSNPVGRRKEIDNVMKRARQGSPGTWDRKLLEVEEKDPNRWRHTGYKQLYLDGSKSPSPRRSRTPGPRRSRTPLRRSRSPAGVGRRNTRSPVGRRSRSPGFARRKSRSRSARRSPRRSPIRRSPVRRPRSPAARRPPPPSSSSSRAVPPRAAPPRRPPSPPSPPPARERPPEPKKAPPNSSSGSSTGSCSDESCSVCSAKNKKVKPTAPPPKPRPAASREVPPRRGPPPPRPGAAPPRPAPPLTSGGGGGGGAVQPTRELLRAREASKRTREEKVLEWQRTQLAVNRTAPPAAPPGAPAAPPGVPPTRIKREGERREQREGERREQREGRRARAVSPAAIRAALNDSDSGSDSDASSEPVANRLTLSERFGKMAQWSAARGARLENMRITRRQAGPGGLQVHIEPGDRAQEHTGELEEEPIGSYPEELLAVAPGGLPSWDDVTVRYDYYKKRGYLRGLTLGDYVKWEEWWYKYQEWLKRERAYERWADAEAGLPVRRERRRRGGRHRRS